ncbi:hydroxymethylbilane synthase [Gelidibacter algens]|uniref:Hydroxymethylbilane synthase n=1 Tax=Gelidibacter algens TaxID=49280 RepID=A0A1A7R239_9FLAO|nr:hydroxymethylbilane synthase [Gelidibacter algens]OBX24847.1 hydroxymethylbilane synthase [Gelidibacter algens]RAJ24432.1 hydroxymethylbilane synthase [Gelidibacter algens]
MSKLIRIGTRDSELALWQAKAVQQQIEHLGHKTVLVPVKSTGDLLLDKPIYELGIIGVFTKILDMAMLNDDIDIAVHSLKDVPTLLPQGIVQAAVLKRGNVRDTLVFKDNEEFLSQKEATIATGSLRRKAQWLNRYPTHTVVGLRGNVNTRLQKLEDHDDWNAAIFAAAGIGRIGVRPDDAINLDWMVPAPAQGAIMITARSADEELLSICKEINHEETEICTTIERKFLNLLEGGCSAPIGALAFIKNEEVHFQGVLLSLDGSKKIEVTRNEKLGNHHNMAQYAADYVLERGGNRVMNDLKDADKKIHVFSTKNLSEMQRQRFKNINVESTDFLKISLNRIPKPILKSAIDNVIITSQNAVDAITAIVPKEELQFKNIYCVGRRTKKLIESKIGKVKHSENYAKSLAEYLVEFIDGTEVTHFCSDIRLDELSQTLEKNHIKVNEVEAYKTILDSEKIDSSVEGIMFYSPSTVDSYLKNNSPNDKVAYCIGETTATEAKKYFEDVRVAKLPTVESVIDLVNAHYNQ